MNIEQCRYERTCEAQLCPLNKDIDNYVFYADEVICKHYDFRSTSSYSYPTPKISLIQYDCII